MVPDNRFAATATSCDPFRCSLHRKPRSIPEFIKRHMLIAKLGLEPNPVDTGVLIMAPCDECGALCGNNIHVDANGTVPLSGECECGATVRINPSDSFNFVVGGDE